VWLWLMAERSKLGGRWTENGRVLDGMDTKVKRRTHPGDVRVYRRVALYLTLNEQGVKTHRQARYTYRGIRLGPTLETITKFECT